MTVGSITKREYLAVNYSDASPFIVTNIEGLNPPSSSINFTESVYKDGSYFNSYNINNRNLVISMDFVTTTKYSTISEVRNKAYELFPPGRDIELEFVSDTLTKPVHLKGYIETHESSLFTDRPGSVVSILCTQPYLYELELTTVQTNNNYEDFRSYVGTAPSPIIFKKTFNNETGTFQISRNTSPAIRFHAIPAGATLEISFDPENRYVTLNKEVSLPAYNYIVGGMMDVKISQTQGHVGVFGNTGDSTPGFEIKFRRMFLGL